MLVNLISNSNTPTYTKNRRENFEVPQSSSFTFGDSIDKTQVDSHKLTKAYRAYSFPKSADRYKNLGSFQIPNIGKGKIYKLNDGHKIVIVSKMGPTVINTFVNAGYDNEPESIDGLSHCLEHILAATNRTKEFTKIGAYSNAMTRSSSTNYYVQFAVNNLDDFEKIIKIQANMFKKPDFSQENLDKEKDIIIAEKKTRKGDDLIKAQNILMANLFDTGYYSGGFDNKIGNITKQNVIDYYNSYYSPDNMTTVIVGNVNLQNSIRLVSKYFNREKSKTPPVYDIHPSYKHHIESTKRVDISSLDTEKAHLEIAFVGPENPSLKDILIGSVLGEILLDGKSSRLNSSLYPYDDRDMNFSSRKVGNNINNPMVISLSSKFHQGDEEEGFEKICSVFSDFAEHPVTPQEIELAKTKLKGYSALEKESSLALSDSIHTSLNSTNSMDLISRQKQILDSITNQDVQEFIQKYIDMNKASVVFVHPEKGTKETNKESKVASKNISFKGNVTNIDEYELSNNLQLAVDTTPGTVRSSVVLELTSPKEIKPKPGVGIIWGMMLNNNKKDNKELGELVDKNSLLIGCDSDINSIKAEVNSDPEKIFESIQVLKNIIYRPNLNQKNFDEVKSNVKEGLKDFLVNPDFKAKEELGSTIYGDEIQEILDNIDDVSLQDIIDFHNQLVRNSQGQLVMVMPAETFSIMKTNILRKLETEFPAFRKTQKLKPLSEEKTPKLACNKFFVQIRDDDQTEITQRFPRKDTEKLEDTVAFNLISELLAGNSESSLYKDLRENQKAVYYVISGYNSDSQIEIKTEVATRNKPFDAFETNSDNLPRALESFNTNIENLADKPVSKEELETAKAMFRNKILSGLEISMSRAGFISRGYRSPYGAEYTNKMFDVIDKITPDDIQKYAQDMFKDKYSVTAITTSRETYEKNKDYLNSLGQVEVLS